MDYETLNIEDKLALARDLLRGRESDHYRVSLLNEPNKDDRLSDLASEIDELKTAVSSLEASVVSPAPPPDPEEPAE